MFTDLTLLNYLTSHFEYGLYTIGFNRFNTIKEFHCFRLITSEFLDILTKLSSHLILLMMFSKLGGRRCG